MQLSNFRSMGFYDFKMEWSTHFLQFQGFCRNESTFADCLCFSIKRKLRVKCSTILSSSRRKLETPMIRKTRQSILVCIKSASSSISNFQRLMRLQNSYQTKNFQIVRSWWVVHNHNHLHMNKLCNELNHVDVKWKQSTYVYAL